MDAALIGGLAFGAVLILWGLRKRPSRYTPLARRQPDYDAPDGPELGLEAVDHSIIAEANRRNASLERNTIWGRKSLTEADIHIPKETDDGDYARRYHRAHNRKTSRRVE